MLESLFLSTVYDETYENIRVYIDGKITKFNENNSTDSQISFNSTNFTNINGNISPIRFDWSDSTTIDINVVIYDIYKSKTIDIPNIGFSITRNSSTIELNGGFFGNDFQVGLLATAGMYYFTKEQYDTTTATIAEIDYLVTKKFN
jgi:hypothetical protein